MEASATSYYRVEDPVQNLKMRIRLRVLAGSDDKEDNKDAGAAKAAHEVAVSVGWQEKRFGPVELNTYLTEKREEKSPGMSTLRAGWRVLAGREAPVLSPHARKMLSACDGTDNDAKSRLSAIASAKGGVHVYTYVDRDAHETKESSSALTTSLAAPSVLSESVASLEKGGGTGLPAGSLRDTTRAAAKRAIVKHLQRDRQFKTMLIMAATDIVSDNGQVSCEEVVLATVRLHKGGLLEMNPGFSEAVSETATDAGNFVSEGAFRTQLKLGARLTSKTFVSESGRTFQYSLENENAMADIRDVEAIMAEERARSARLVTDRRGALPRIFGGGPPPGRVAFRCQAEIVSAERFPDSNEWLSVEWSVVAPRGYDTDGAEDGAAWTSQRDGALCVSGISQMACAALRPPRAAAAAPGAAAGTASPDAGAAEDPAGRFLAGALLLLACVGSVVFGLERAVWPLFGISLVGLGLTEGGEDWLPVWHFGLPIELQLLTPAVARKPLLKSPSAEKGLLADGESKAAESAGPQLPETPHKPPQIFVEVWGTTSHGRQRVVGYGYAELPMTAGNHELRVSTWRPVGSTRERLRDMLLGGSARMTDLRATARPPLETSSFLNKYGLVTEPSGDVRVRVRLQTQDVVPAAAASATEESASRSVGRSVERILADLNSTHRFASAPARRVQVDESQSASDRVDNLLAKLKTEREKALEFRKNLTGSAGGRTRSRSPRGRSPGSGGGGA